MIIVGIVMFVFMVSEGTHGRNDYGDDPYGRGQPRGSVRLNHCRLGKPPLARPARAPVAEW